MPRVGRIPLADGIPRGFVPEWGQEMSLRAGAPARGAAGAFAEAARWAKTPFLEMGFSLFLEYHSFVGKCTHISFVGDAPPSSFSPCAEKKKSAVHGGEEKEGFWVQTCG